MKQLLPNGYDWDRFCNANNIPPDNYWLMLIKKESLYGKVKQFRPHVTLKR